MAGNCPCRRGPRRPPPPPMPLSCAVLCPDACRERPFWPCWNSAELLEQRRPQPACLRCGCCDLERQGCFARCPACGWIGYYEDCRRRCLRSCCDNLVWPSRPGEPG